MLKRLIWICGLLAFMLLGMSAPSAQAAESQTTTDLYIHKFFGLTQVPHDGSELNEEELPEMPRIRNVVFDIYPIVSEMPESGEWALSRVGQKLFMSQKGRIKEVELGSAISGKTDDRGMIKYANLNRGNYYIEENLSASDPEIMKFGQWNSVPIYEGMNPFILQLPMKDPNNSDQDLKAVHIYPKNHDEDPGKEVSEPSVALGEAVTWRIYADLPAKLPDYTAYRIVDQLDERLTFLPETLVVKNNGEVIEKDRDYTVTIKDNFLTMELTEYGRRTLTKRIEVFFDTTVQTSFPVEGENVITNEAEIQFNNSFYPDSDNPGRHPLKGEDPTSPYFPKVNVGDIVIDKQDGDKQQLPGAEFQLSQTKEKNFIKLVVNPSKKTVMRVALDDKLSAKEKLAGYQLWDWVVRPHNKETEFGAGTVYTPHFEGLKTHELTTDGKGTQGLIYYIHETKTPNGYSTLEQAVKIDFGKDAGSDVTNQTGYIVKKAVINNKQLTGGGNPLNSLKPGNPLNTLRPLLPQTGSELSLFITGFGLAIVGCVALVKLKKKQ